MSTETASPPSEFKIWHLFWSPAERRLRALIRLGLLLLTAVIIAFPIVLVLTGLISFDIVPESILTGLVFNVVVGAVVLGASVFLAAYFIDRRTITDLGFHINGRWWGQLAFGLALGAVLMAAIFLVELALGWITITGTFVVTEPDMGFGLAILFPTLGFIGVGIYEELLSRGYLLRNFAEGLTGWWVPPLAAVWVATFLSSAIFGLLHATNPNATAVSTFNLFLAGLFLATGYILTRELAIPIGLHITWNFFQGNVFGFPVSGNTNLYATFIAVEQGGPEWLTGGPFGPEAGVIGVIAIAVGIVATVLFVRWQTGEAQVDRTLAQYLVRKQDWSAE